MADMEIDDEHAVNASDPKNKRLSVERIYQKKSQLEHILLRPDTYIGSVEHHTQKMWVWDGDVETGRMAYREITFVPGLYKIYDEILVNAADNKQRDKNMDCIKIDIDPENNVISVWNNGKGIPIVEHKDEKMYVPTLIFGHLLTSSNYNDEEKKVTGGRNGYGAKLCNIFSNKFTIETLSKAERKAFKQTWTDNMKKTTDEKIKSVSGANDFTKVTFHPDLSKFKMSSLDPDTVALMTRRAFDVAGCTKGVKVFLNGTRLPVKNFKEYVGLYTKGLTDDMDKSLQVVYEQPNERWEVACTYSTDNEFRQMSFVNSIATTKGGTHVDYVADQVVKRVTEKVTKMNKGGHKPTKKQIKDHMWLFVNCLIENPTFDSQTKENMTLQAKNFGSKCELSDKFYNSVLKCGIIEAVMAFIQMKTQKEMVKKCHKTKHSKLSGLPKLEDANDAGTTKSIDCTLILTEGDSAKTLAVSGLSVVGRDKYGVFPLRGKILNVRDASAKQILECTEINNIIKILGLQYGKKYETIESLKTLRYGRMMIMTDQDHDGSHIKGLLINFIHTNWPSLLKLPFLEEFITPIVKVTKGNQVQAFYSLPEFEEWKQSTPNWNTWRVKYYKGLGTSTAKEAKEYFADMLRHRVCFKYQGTEDDNAIQLAFNKKFADARKDWLRSGMEERKQRRELGLPEIYLYGKQTRSISYTDFINKELILFSNLDNERSIPAMVDGLKPGQRKVLFTCFKRNDKREVKVAQLAGSVAEHSAYHHGEVSLMSTIVNLAQNYVGSNNINLLQPIGQFGTRLQGGKDSASPRYIFTKLSPLTRLIMPGLDDPVLNFLFEDNQRIEPEFYVPILPMVLVNGADGIGTGWSTKIPNFNPRDLVKNLRLLMQEEPQLPLVPWFKGFRGTIEVADGQRFVVNGEIAILGDDQVEITELPIKVWTQTYKEQVLEPLLRGTEKVEPIISEYKEYHTDTTVKFIVTVSSPSKLAALEHEGLHKVFKLQSTLATSSMVLFDHEGVVKTYESPEEILEDFYEVRLKTYVKRKDYMVGLLSAEAKKLENQARFILEKIENQIRVENRKKRELIRTLLERGYDPDPILRWKKQVQSSAEQEAEAGAESGDEEGAEEEQDSSAKDFDYILSMTMWSLTQERKEDLLKKRDAKRQELEALKLKTPKDLWTDDLDAFLAKLDEVEAKEREDELAGMKAKMEPQKGRGGKKNLDSRCLPSPQGQRVVPKMDIAIKKRIETAVSRKRLKAKKEKGAFEEEDEDVQLIPLSERLGNSPDLIEAKLAKKATSAAATNGNDVTAAKKMRQTKLNFNPKSAKTASVASPKKRKKNYSDSSDGGASDGGNDRDEFVVKDENGDAVVIPPERREAPRRAAAAKALKKYKFDDDSHSDDDDVVSNGELFSSDDEDSAVSKPKAAAPKPKAAPKTATATNGKPRSPKPTTAVAPAKSPSPVPAKVEVDSDDDSDASLKPLAERNRESAAATSSAMFDSLLGDSSSSPVKPKTAAARKMVDNSDDDFDSFCATVKNRPAISSDDDNDSDFEAALGRKGSTTTATKVKLPTKAATKLTTAAAKPAKTAAGGGAGRGKKTDAGNKPQKAPAARQPKKKKANSSSDDDDAIVDDAAMTIDDSPIIPRETTGRVRKAAKYNFDDSDDDIDY